MSNPLDLGGPLGLSAAQFTEQPLDFEGSAGLTVEEGTTFIALGGLEMNCNLSLPCPMAAYRGEARYLIERAGEVLDDDETRRLATLERFAHARFSRILERYDSPMVEPSPSLQQMHGIGASTARGDRLRVLPDAEAAADVIALERPGKAVFGRLRRRTQAEVLDSLAFALSENKEQTFEVLGRL